MREKTLTDRRTSVSSEPTDGGSGSEMVHCLFQLVQL